MSEVSLTQLFNNVMMAAGATTQPGGPVISCYMNNEKRFAFLEFRSVEETSNAMAFDGLQCQGETLKVRRPHDYNPAAAKLLGPTEPSAKINLALLGVVNTLVEDGPNKVFVGGLPGYLSEEQVRQILQAFGPLRAFNLVTDRDTGASKGYGFCEYADPNITDVAIQGLSALIVGGKPLTVRRANTAGEASATLQTLIQQQQAALDLVDDGEYMDLMEDVTQEVGKYGKLVGVEIPRPPPDGGPDPPGVGFVYLCYEDPRGAERAQVALNGRKFGDNLAEATFYDRSRFDAKDLS
ncbi:hypothetical protein VOLCADRAFT_121741 [Volvox carteri f. nagariensis]|uniref:RRM domain-containing protein n=1 Tax=Volvox carteri f. nagariensis TaxID=3068 RepID=D8UJ72_VOLCA|nr:uncharacterized protein VOLCADRAFT_121741 [Volvox carteri f. nagariensis]EFJ40221.1 hypothetical protein VOLCADRAFT_121741 [Volvox carteri f. nagariensis]|eukprot:XP_002958701.1 hypothetical protein VOLCADRAFT_121741 [Volvox carteri f. nagariensis]